MFPFRLLSAGYSSLSDCTCHVIVPVAVVQGGSELIWFCVVDMNGVAWSALYFRLVDDVEGWCCRS